jgi:hypothetical protein
MVRTPLISIVVRVHPGFIAREANFAASLEDAMKLLLAVTLAAGLAGATLGITSSAQAMPLSPIAAPNDLVTQVAGGCGRGYHRGPRGACLRNYANPAAHPCPRGWYLGRYGRCRANGT